MPGFGIGIGIGNCACGNGGGGGVEPGQFELIATGSSHIETGIVPTGSGFSFEAPFAYNGVVGTDPSSLDGVRDTAVSQERAYLATLFKNVTVKINKGWGNEFIEGQFGSLSDTLYHMVKKTGALFEFDEQQYTAPSVDAYSYNGTEDLYLFRQNLDGSPSGGMPMRRSYFNAWSDAAKSTQVAGMFAVPKDEHPFGAPSGFTMEENGMWCSVRGQAFYDASGLDGFTIGEL